MQQQKNCKQPTVELPNCFGGELLQWPDRMKWMDENINHQEKGLKDMEASPGRAVELIVPAQSSMMLVIRLTTAGFMARAGLTLDAMEDLKMAVEEACNCLMMQKRACAALHVRFFREPSAMRVSIEAEGECAGQAKDAPLNVEELSVIRCILESMTDEVILHSEGDRIGCIELVRRMIP